MTADIRRVTLIFANGTAVTFLEDISLYDTDVQKNVFAAPFDSENGDNLALEMTWAYAHQDTHPAHSAMKADDPALITLSPADQPLIPVADTTPVGVQLVDRDITGRPPLAGPNGTLIY